MRLLVVVAHPDDGSFGCGSILARAAANRHESAVVCATLGEAGESRVETEDLAALRESELRAAAAILGVGLVRLLGHVDSGMADAPPPGALVSVDPAMLAAEVQASSRRSDPTWSSPSTPATAIGTTSPFATPRWPPSTPAHTP